MRNVASETIRHAGLSTAAGVMLIGVFGPWLRSGASARSSFELLDIVERLGFSPSGGFAWAVRAWPLVPLLIVAAVVACWAGRSAAGAGLGIWAGLYVSGVAFGVSNAPDAGLIRTGWGVTVSLISGLVVMSMSCWIAVAARSR